MFRYRPPSRYQDRERFRERTGGTRLKGHSDISEPASGKLMIIGDKKGGQMVRTFIDSGQNFTASVYVGDLDT